MTLLGSSCFGMRDSVALPCCGAGPIIDLFALGVELLDPLLGKALRGVLDPVEELPFGGRPGGAAHHPVVESGEGLAACRIHEAHVDGGVACTGAKPHQHLGRGAAGAAVDDAALDEDVAALE